MIRNIPPSSSTLRHSPMKLSALTTLTLLTLLTLLIWASPLHAADKVTPPPLVADTTRGQPPAGAINLLPTGDFEAADESGESPKGWQVVDGLVWQWVTDTDVPERGKILRINTDVNQSQAYQWWAKRYVHNAPLADAPAREATKPPRYDTIGGIDGGFYWSAFFPIQKGKAYKLYIDAKGPPSKVFLRGYVKELTVSFADENPAAQAVLRKARNEPETDANGRPVRYRLRYKYTTWFAVGGSDKWETYTHIKPRHPTSREITEDVRYLRVMIYPYWPAGVYDYDNVRVVEVEPDTGQATPDVPEVDREEGNVIR